MNVSDNTTAGTGGPLFGSIVVVGADWLNCVVVVVVVTGSDSASLIAFSYPPHPEVAVGIELTVKPGSTIETVPVSDEYGIAPCALVRVTTWKGPTGQLFIVGACDQSNSISPATNAAPLAGSMPPSKSLVATACTLTTAGELDADELDEPGESGKLTWTSTGWNERLDCGIVIRPFGVTVAEAEPMLDMPATVNVGVNTDRCIEMVTSPASAMTAPALGAIMGAITATASATAAAMASRRFLALEARKVTFPIFPATDRTE